MTTEDTQIKSFSYETPPQEGRAKKLVHLSRNGVLDLHVQTIRKGVKNNMHYHTNCDEAFLVLNGRVKFYGENDIVLGEYGPNEGVTVPADAQYWFEAVSEEPLEIMRIGATHLGQQERRINVGEMPDWMKEEGKVITEESKRERW
ncbi:MAG: cupin domain-containing protein [Pseudomonadota bacterium]